YLAKKHYWELPDLVEYCETVPRVVVLAVVHTLHAFGELDVKPLGIVPRYRRAVREPSVQVPPVRTVAPVRRSPVAAGTSPPVGAAPRLPAAREPLRVPEHPAVLGEDRAVPADQVHVAKAMSASEHFRRGEVALRREDFASAVKEFRTATELDGSWP